MSASCPKIHHGIMSSKPGKQGFGCNPPDLTLLLDGPLDEPAGLPILPGFKGAEPGLLAIFFEPLVRTPCQAVLEDTPRRDEPSRSRLTLLSARNYTSVPSVLGRKTVRSLADNHAKFTGMEPSACARRSYVPCSSILALARAIRRAAPSSCSAAGAVPPLRDFGVT